MLFSACSHIRRFTNPQLKGGVDSQFTRVIHQYIHHTTVGLDTEEEVMADMITEDLFYHAILDGIILREDTIVLPHLITGCSISQNKKLGGLKKCHLFGIAKNYRNFCRSEYTNGQLTRGKSASFCLPSPCAGNSSREGLFTALKVTAASSGPDTAMFKRFKEQWAWIDQSSYSTAAKMVEIAPFRERTLQFAAENLKVCQPQDDLREFMELVIIFLGGTPTR